MWVELSLFILLGVCAVCDGLKREIPLVVVWFGIAVAAILHLQGSMEEHVWLTIFMSLIPGIMFWMLAFVTREKVGYGDGWMLIMIGLFTGLWNCFLILLAGLIAETIAVLFLMAFQRVSGDCRIPFAPFLLLGMGVVMCL